MANTLTHDEQITLKKAAFGAVQLVSMAYPGAISSMKENMAGTKALTGATGLIGEILATKDKWKIDGKSTAEVAAEVLPALTATVTVLQAKAPDEVDNFRTMVSIALDQAAQSTSGPKSAQKEMIAKIQAALNPA